MKRSIQHPRQPVAQNQASEAQNPGGAQFREDLQSRIMTTNQPAPIVCGFDFSNTGRDAAEVAAMMANQLNTSLKLVFVRDSDPTGLPPEAVTSADEYYLERLTEEVRQLGKTGATIEAIMRHGTAADTLIRIVKEEQARMLIVGWHGVNTRWRIGKEAERAAEHCPGPTLVIQNPEPLKSWLNQDRPLKILVGIDFSACSEAALLVAALYDIGPCEISATYLDRPSEELRRMGFTDSYPNVQGMVEEDLQEKISGILGSRDIKITTLGTWASKPNELIAQAVREKADLIVIGSHQWHGTDRAFHTSVSHAVLHHSPTNVACAPRLTLPSKSDHSA